VVDGAEGHAIELGVEGFGATGVDLGGDVGDADGFLKEGGFLALGLGEGDGYVWAADRDGDAREAGSGAEVEERGDAGGRAWAQAMDSTKWRERMASGSRTEVRLVRVFQRRISEK